MKTSNVLIVDDSQTINLSISSVLNENGIQTTSAFDAEAAWVLLEKTTFDLIILDVVLPESNGFQLCKRIKTRDEYKDISIIFITGLADKDNIVHAFELGAVDYIIKPFNISELLARVKIHLELVLTKKTLQNEIKEHQLKAIALKESEENYKLLFDNMTNGFIVSQFILDNNNTFPKFKVLSVNNAFNEITGLNQHNEKELFIAELFKDKEEEDIYNKFKNVALYREQYKFQFYSQYIDKFLNITIFAPKYGFFALIIEDITQQKKAEIELQNSEKQLREFNETKDKFFSIIAHDLRSPFTSIIGLSELMVNETDLSSTEYKEYAHLIYQSSSKTYDLIENLLSWAKSQMGSIKNNPRDVNAEQIVNDIIGILSEKARQKKLLLINKIEPDSIIFVDKDMLNTVLRNLLNNAVSFTSEQGKVTIEMKVNNHDVEFSVEDTGVGIEKEHLMNIFRIDINKLSIGNSKEKGNGLGLVICKEFVQKMGGKINATSKIGIGSKFYFTIPNAIRKN